jgi:proteasome accessory factor C
MDKIDRIYLLHNLLRSHRFPVSLKTIQDELECSERTARRTISYLRNTLKAPLDYDKDRHGYFYQEDEQGPYELPGLWFSAEELFALLVSHRLLAEVQPGLLDTYLEPLQQRIENIIKHQHAGSPEILHRIRILQMSARPTNLQQFRQIATALLERRDMRILYHGRERDKTTERIVSPQRLVYYRSNWYLDAWCHLRQGLRNFSLDRLYPVETLEQQARDVPEQELDAHFASGYGIFAGPPKTTAVLRFSPSAARWVADEQWHPNQQDQVFPDGSYELRIPYSDERELIGDILRHGPDVEVLEPPELRRAIAEKLTAALEKYESI